MPPLLDHLGRPIAPRQLQREIAGPSITGIRQILSGHPASGITPERLASLLREAEDGDATRYLELAEDMEERDLHYQGVLGTRKRSVTQLEITVEAATDDSAGQEHADLVREWIDRDELEDELFDVLDAVGKGYSVTEIVWDIDRSRWFPARLEWRDPRWFDFDRSDGRTVLLRVDGDDPLAQRGLNRMFQSGFGRADLPPHKFIIHTHKAKSGLPIRGGLARVAAWAWMFKTYSLKDWVIFAEVYGQPIRVGKYGAGASPADKETLFRAVANIASDCAAIIPDSMLIEFVKAEGAGGSTTSSTLLYKGLCDWLDQQVSKAVLGQTTTTDAISGGHAVAREHRLVQEDIERSDAKLLAGTLNRQLVPNLVAFNFGPQRLYPRLRIGRTEPVDLEAETRALERLVPLGLEVEASIVRDRLGYPDPPPGATLLQRGAGPARGLPGAAGGEVPGGGDMPDAGGDEGDEPGDGDADPDDTVTAGVRHRLTCPHCGSSTHQAAPGAGPVGPRDAADELADALERATADESTALVDEIKGMVERASSLPELADELDRRFRGAPPAALTDLLGNALFIAELTGRGEIEDADDGGDEA